MEINGKVFFITGGAQGLGNLYAKAVLERGAKVYFCDVNAGKGEEALKEMTDKFGDEKVRFKAFDVTDKVGFSAAFNQAVSEFGQVDVMVNNAGIMNEGQWELMIQVNITALVYGTKLATEHMRKDKGGKGGRIINISSTAGLDDFPFISIYCGTKHAVRSFTSSLAKQPNLDQLGIEYGLLCPAATATDLMMTLDDTKIDFADMFIPYLEKKALPPAVVADAFVQLVTLKNMNGTILMIGMNGVEYKKLDLVNAAIPLTLALLH